MGITSKDIAAQRAMLARGEEKRLRDQFAASVLPICNRNNRTDEQIAENEYRLADAMLHERAKRQAIAATEKAMRDAEGFVAIREQFLAWQKEQSVASSCSQPFDSAPTTSLTAEEREAIKGCIAYDEAARDTLRKLLERLA